MVRRSTKVGLPKPNPYLAPGDYSVAHYDPAATDIIRAPISSGNYKVDLAKLPRVEGGPITILTCNANKPGYYWGASNDRVTYIDARNRSWKKVAEKALPGIQMLTKAQLDAVLMRRYQSLDELQNVVYQHWGPWRIFTMANNIYALVDIENTLFATTVMWDSASPEKGVEGTYLMRYGIEEKKESGKIIKELARWDSRSHLHKGMTIVGVNMTYDGKLILVCRQSILITERDLSKILDSVDLPADQGVSNSACVDENNGIYLASGSLEVAGQKGTLWKFVWTGHRLSKDAADGAWQADYSGGNQPPTVKHGYGTGSTPTLMGFGDDPQKLVVITDGQDRMNLVAFWRDEIPANARPVPGALSPRTADVFPITCGLNPLPEFIQSEQSVVVMNYGAFVVNNIPSDIGKTSKNLLIDSMATGPVLPTAYGVEKVVWDSATMRWRSGFKRPDISSTSMVPAVSPVSNTIVMNGYSKTEGWLITMLDWDTGEQVGQVVFGIENQLGNGFYSIFEYIGNSDQIFNSIGGPIRIPFSTLKSKQ
jgi:hypothetical protein